MRRMIIAVVFLVAVFAVGIVASPLLAGGGVDEDDTIVNPAPPEGAAQEAVDEYYCRTDGIPAGIKDRIHTEGMGVPAGSDVPAEDKERLHLEGMGFPQGQKDKQHLEGIGVPAGR